MACSRRQLEREILRQIVELESLRKRALDRPELLERIERLEESQFYVLRNLAKCIEDASKTEAAGSPSTPPSPPESAGSPSRSCRPAFARELLSVRSSASGRSLDSRGGGTTVRAGKVRLKRVELPHLDAKCASCGKLLLSRMLAGGEVVLVKDAWFHGECVEGGPEFRKPAAMN